MTPNNQNILTDIFRMAENHNVTISFSYDLTWKHFKVEVRRGDLDIHKYIVARDFTKYWFVMDLIRDMINEVDRAERAMKEKERKDV